MLRHFKRIYYFIILLVVIIAGGSLGYILIEGWSLSDSFYMTIITVSTVGYGEVAELSFEGKMFTAFLIISSFGTFAYAITSLTMYLVSGDYKRYVKQLKMDKTMDHLSNHIIICGLGRVGKQVLTDLVNQGHSCLAIENNQEIVDENDSDSYIILKGDCTRDELLLKAGIKRARAVVACLPKDADNLYIVLAAKELSPSVNLISRASRPYGVSKLKIAGATNVIMPDSIGGSHMAALVAKPDAMEFIDEIKVSDNHDSNVESITFEQLPDNLKGKSIRELAANKLTGVTIVGYKSASGEYIINPNLDLVIEPNSKIFVLGDIQQIENFVNHFRIN